jgi:hypothetical protein
MTFAKPHKMIAADVQDSLECVLTVFVLNTVYLFKSFPLALLSRFW